MEIKYITYVYMIRGTQSTIYRTCFICYSYMYNLRRGHWTVSSCRYDGGQTRKRLFAIYGGRVDHGGVAVDKSVGRSLRYLYFVPVAAAYCVVFIDRKTWGDGNGDGSTSFGIKNTSYFVPYKLLL